MSAAFLPLHGADALRRLEADACAALGGDASVLMQRAGEAAWRCALQHWPEAQCITVVCGPGNNGGDGYVLARHALESGRAVQVLHLPAHAPRTDLAQQAAEAYRGAGGTVVDWDGRMPSADLLVDAVFGLGLQRAPDAGSAALLEAINAADRPVLALDVPSGVDSSRGHVPGVAVRATRTVQFMAEHAGLRTGAALETTGALQLATLAIPASVRDALPVAAGLVDGRHPPAGLPPRGRNSHKGRHGHVLCVGGDHGFGGAALLCSDAALHAGAGLVSLASRAATVQASLARRPECMAITADAADDLAPLLERASVVALGPGIGQSPWARALFTACVASSLPLVVDADALTLLVATPCTLHDAVLTPHPGEAARLLGSDVASVQADRLAAAEAIAERYSAAVVLKGAGTVVAARGHTPRIIGAGNPGMAVGGMGDVLTGIIAALRGQGLDVFEAAVHGAWLHAATADAIAAQHGQRGLLPSHVIAALPRLLSEAASP